jgi:hypothetical protein
MYLVDRSLVECSNLHTNIQMQHTMQTIQLYKVKVTSFTATMTWTDRCSWWHRNSQILIIYFRTQDLLTIERDNVRNKLRQKYLNSVKCKVTIILYKDVKLYRITTWTKLFCYLCEIFPAQVVSVILTAALFFSYSKLVANMHNDKIITKEEAAALHV